VPSSDPEDELLVGLDGLLAVGQRFERRRKTYLGEGGTRELGVTCLERRVRLKAKAEGRRWLYDIGICGHSSFFGEGFSFPLFHSRASLRTKAVSLRGIVTPVTQGPGIEPRVRPSAQQGGCFSLCPCPPDPTGVWTLQILLRLYSLGLRIHKK